MKKAGIIAFHLLAISHGTFIFLKENQTQIDGVIFVFYVIALAVFWKKFSKKMRSKYE
ncbi:hypothetical protein K2X05_00400 [bacterium]|nr:hypothetical protein [bacterium]